MNLQRHRRGLSMIELVLVILVLGLVAAIATPRFAESLRVARLEAAAQQLAGHIRYLRSVAMNEGKTVTLVFNENETVYGCDTVDSPERIGEPLFVSLHESFDPSIQLRADFDSVPRLSFDLEGVPYVDTTPMSLGRVILQSSSDRFRISIDSGTGTTTVTRLTSDDSPDDDRLIDEGLTELSL